MGLGFIADRVKRHKTIKACELYREKYKLSSFNFFLSYKLFASYIIAASMTPPSFAEKLMPQYRREGEPVRLTVKVTGIPAPTVTWYREGRRLISSPDFEIKQEGDIHSLYIPEVFYEDTGRFSVRAENPAGEITSTASLTVERK